MMARKKKTKKKNGVTVDMAGVESGGTHPEGEFPATVEEVTLETSESSGQDYLKWVCKTEKGKLFFNTSLQPQALFNLRSLLEAMDQEVPDGPMDIDFDEMVDEEFVAVVVHEKYEGKMRARVTDYLSADGFEGGEDDSPSVDDDDDLPKISEEELGDMDLEDIVELVDKYGLDVNLKKFKSVRKKIGAVSEALEDAGYLEED